MRYASVLPPLDQECVDQGERPDPDEHERLAVGLLAYAALPVATLATDSGLLTSALPVGSAALLVIVAAGPPLALLVLAPLLVLALLVATRGFVVAPTKLAPKLSRISPIATAGLPFSRDSIW